MRKQMRYMGCLFLLSGLLLESGQEAYAKTGTGSVSVMDADGSWDDEWTEDWYDEDEKEDGEDSETPDDDQTDDNDDQDDDDDENGAISFSKCQCSIAKNVYSYTGAKIQPKVSVTGPKKDEAGITQENVSLVEGTDYTVTYEKNKNYGVGRIIIQGIGNYTGYHIEKFGIVPGQVKGVKVKSPYFLENTVTWKKVAGADGYYIYRKASGGDYKFICNVTDENFQVFHDRVGVKNGQSYSYRVTAYVEDEKPYETTTVSEGVYGQDNGSDEDGYDYDDYDYDDYDDYDMYRVSAASYYGVENSVNYYEKAGDYEIYSPYDYSCVKGKCKVAFEALKYGSASGRVTKTIAKKRINTYTGQAVMDYMAYLTGKKIIKSSMNDEKRIKAVYDWIVKNCTFTKDVKEGSKLKKMKQYYKYDTKVFQKKAAAYEKKLMKQIYTGKALCSGFGFNNSDRGLIAFAYHKGSCSFLTPMFTVLCRAAGVEAHGIDGDYVNKDKSRDYHNWALARIGKTYYWYDVAVATKRKDASQVWYKKGTKFWKTCHAWQNSETKKFQTASFAK